MKTLQHNTAVSLHRSFSLAGILFSLHDERENTNRVFAAAAKEQEEEEEQPCCLFIAVRGAPHKKDSVNVNILHLIGLGTSASVATPKILLP